jgi:hypothetical protein
MNQDKNDGEGHQTIRVQQATVVHGHSQGINEVVTYLAENVGAHDLSHIIAIRKISADHHFEEVLINTGFVKHVVGFGKAGKVEITLTGMQLVSQFGDYLKYLESEANRQSQPQTIIVPMMVADDDQGETSVAAIHTSRSHKNHHRHLKRK